MSKSDSRVRFPNPVDYLCKASDQLVASYPQALPQLESIARPLTSQTEEEWQDFGCKLGSFDKALMWWIGDWLNWAGIVQQGITSEAYGKMVEITQLERKTIQDAKYVSKKVNSSIRIEELDWGHHQVIASLPQEKQIELLAWAVNHEPKKATVRELRAEIMRRGRATKW